MLKSLYKKAFDIRDGEITISFFMQLYIFLVITVLLIVKPTVNALFLSALGAERLPYGYLLVAAVAILSSYFYNKALKRYSFKKVATITLCAFGFFFMLLSVALHYKFLEVWLLYYYYVLISLFAVVVTSQFWILANMVYNAREAKRLFGFIGSGAIAGGIFGGYLTTLISAAFGNKTSILIAGILILCCVPILYRIWNLRLRTLSMYTRKKEIHQVSNPDRNAFQIILKSKHLLYLASIIGISVLVAKLVDFQFSDFAHKAIPDSDELASFLGFWFSSFNVVALLIQLFVTNRVLSYLGVTSTMLILPLGIALGSLLFLTVPELWVLIIIKGLDGSFKQSINKAAAELSILPIPYAIKNQAKSFIDIVVDSVATGIAGFLLIFVIKGMELDTKFVTILTIFFLFIWLLLIYKLRDAYFDSFRSNLKSLLLNKDESKRNFRKERTIATARHILQNGEESEILTLLSRLSSARLNPLKKQIVALLDHPSNAIKIAAIEELYYYKEGTALHKIKALLHTSDSALIIATLQYLLHHTKIDDQELFTTYLDHPEKPIANAALLCLAQDARLNTNLGKQFNLRDRIATQIERLGTPEGLENVAETSDLLLSIAYSGLNEFYYFISIHFSNKNKKVAKKAIEAAGITTDPLFVGNLLQFLENKKLRKAAIKSLTQYGPEITKTLLRLENEDAFSLDIKRNLPKVIATFNSQNAVKILFKFLGSNNLIVRKNASKSLLKLSSKNPSLTIDKRKISRYILLESNYYQSTLNALATFTKLVNNPPADSQDEAKETEVLLAREAIVLILKEQVDQSLHSIFTLLSIRYNQEDISAAFLGIKSKDDTARINAIEFLDNLLHIKLKNKILPLLEVHIIDTDVDNLHSQEMIEQTEFDAVRSLIRNRSRQMNIAMLHLIEILEDTKYIAITQSFTKHKNTNIAKLATRVSTSLQRVKQQQK